MKFKAKCLYLNGKVGTPEEIARMPSFIGTLWLLVDDDPDGVEVILEARLIDEHKLDLLPRLSNVKIVYGEEGMMLVRGYASSHEAEARHKQCWYLLPVAEH